MATDTLSMATDLEAAGLERRQAVGVTKAISDAVADLATKDDLERVIDKLTIRIYGALAVCTGLLIGAIAIATAIALRGAG